MGLPQWHMQTRRGVDRGSNAPLSCRHPEGLLRTPSAASLPMHSLYPSPLGSKTLPNGTRKWSAFLLLSLVWGPLPGTDPQRPGSGSQRWVNFTSFVSTASPWGCLIPTARISSIKFPSQMAAGWPLTVGPHVRENTRPLDSVEAARDGAQPGM